MKYFIKSLALVCLCIAAVVNAAAQSRLITITGSFTQKKNYEILIVGKSGDKSFRVIEHFIDPANTNFSLVFPVSTNANYQMQVKVMKMGSRRLEAETNATFPLNLTGKNSINLTVDPIQFDQKAGFKVEKLPAKFATIVVSGSLKDATFGTDLSFSKAEEGRLQTIQTNFIAKGDSSFNFLVPIEKEGFYYISTMRWRKRVYLKSSDQMKLVLDAKTGLQVSTVTSPENQLIAQWEQLFSPVSSMLFQPKPDREAFTAVYKPLQVTIEAFIQGIKTPNAKFNSLFKTAVQLDNNLAALSMLLKSSKEKIGVYFVQSKDFLNVPDYYKQVLQDNRLSSADVVQFGEGNDYINLNAKFSLTGLDETQRKQLDDAERVKLMMTATANDTLKAFLLKSQLEELELNVSNYTEFSEVFMPYQQYAKLPSVKRKFDGLLKMFIADTAFLKKSSYDFSLPDANGKMVNMRDFKGKVVLIDVWATWCGPCKAQMPFLKEVEEHYKGNDNVVFVGISLDAAKDKQKWLNMINEKQLEGVQLLDDFGKTFGRKYKMIAIPRFLLIDKNGNWAEIRCPLPENKEKLKKYIDKELHRNS